MRNSPNRWIIALVGVWLQLFLGTVYAWSYFQQPLVDKYGWTNTSVAWTFSLTICCLGLAAAWGGMKVPRYGPRKLAIVGSVLFGLGYLLAAAALQWRSLPLLYFGYGVIGGTGLGLCYVTPVATVAKWFPDKKGLATGLVIMGFGFGALLMSKLIAPAPLCLVGRQPGDGLSVAGRVFHGGDAVGRRLAPRSAARLRAPGRRGVGRGRCSGRSALGGGHRLLAICRHVAHLFLQYRGGHFAH